MGLPLFTAMRQLTTLLKKITMAIKRPFNIEQIYSHAKKHGYKSQLNFINFIKGE